MEAIDYGWYGIMNQKCENMIYENSGRINICLILIVLYLSHNIIPAVGAFMPSIAYFGLFVLVIIISGNYICLNNSKRFSILSVLPVYSVSILQIVLYVFTGSFSAVPMYVYGVLQVLILGCTAMYVIDNHGYKGAKFIVYFIIVAFVITAITTYFGCITYEHPSRYMAAHSSGMLYELYTKSNIGSFSFAYQLVLINPLIVYLTKEKKIPFIIGIGVILFIGIVLIEMEYTSAVILYIVSSIFLLSGKLTKKKIVAFVVIICLLIVFGSEFLGSVLDKIASAIDNPIFSSRLQYLSGSLTGTDVGNISESGDRLARYMRSISIFFDTWTLGNWTGNSGGHSYIFDTIAVYGLLGILAIIIMYRRIYTLYIRPFKNTTIFPYIYFVYLMGIFMAVINPKPFPFIFIFVIPLFSYVETYFERIQEKARMT